MEQGGNCVGRADAIRESCSLVLLSTGSCMSEHPSAGSDALLEGIPVPQSYVVLNAPPPTARLEARPDDLERLLCKSIDPRVAGRLHKIQDVRDTLLIERRKRISILPQRAQCRQVPRKSAWPSPPSGLMAGRVRARK